MFLFTSALCSLFVVFLMLSLFMDSGSAMGGCLDADDVAESAFLVSTLVDVCECVPRGLMGAYYNPVTMAVSAMLVPNIVYIVLLFVKYSKPLRAAVINKLKACLTEDEIEYIKVGGASAAEIFAEKACVAINVLTLMLNLIFQP